MSLDDSNTPAPETASPPPSGESRPGLGGKVPLIGGLVLLLVLGVIGFFVFGGDDGDASDCVPEKVRLTTASATESIIEDAIAAFEKEEDCIDVVVTTGSVKDVVEILGDPDAEMPDLWIPDSPAWKGQLGAAGWTGAPSVEVVAQTPVALVSGPPTPRPASWFAAMDSGNLVLADPNEDGASTLALLAPYAEIKKTGQSPDVIEERMVPVAQSYGDRVARGDDTAVDPGSINASSTQLLPITEQDYLSAKRSNSQVTLVAPRTGAPMLQFPLLSINQGKIDLVGSGRDVGARVGRAIGRWLESEAGKQAIVDADLRGPDGKPLAGGAGFGSMPGLPKVPGGTTDEVLRGWRVLAVPSSMLALFDLSGSMKEPIGNTTRTQLTVDAALLAMNNLADSTRVGTWGFSKNRGEDNQAWEEFVPMRLLGAEVDGTTQREILLEDAPLMPKRVRGATAVFDAVLAAYKEALTDWDEAHFNAVVVFTDGASDDSSSIGIDQLVTQLQTLRDPARRVQVVVIGISADADTPELQQITEAVGGDFYLVTRPEDMVGVLANALLNR